MELTIKKPAVMEPSHIPRRSLHTKSPEKLLQAAWDIRAMAQTKILRLGIMLVVDGLVAWTRCSPHPFANGEPLEGKVLGVFKDQITDVEYRSEPGRTKRQTCEQFQGVDKQYQLYLSIVIPDRSRSHLDVFTSTH